MCMCKNETEMVTKNLAAENAHRNYGIIQLPLFYSSYAASISE